MKKLIVVALTLFIGTTAFSQELDLGIKAGANFANISDASSLSNKTGFQAGIFAGIKFTENVGIQADLLYSQQGAEFDAGEFDLTYVNVPVVLKYYLVKGLNIQAGPQFGFIVDDQIKDVLGNIYDAEKSDVSGIVGAGYDFPFGIRVDARYNFGLSDVSKDLDGKNKNNVFSVALGYSFL
ncbi:porin family protein [Aequorivita flava]|uniref:Porin family protein n=1 Tax=Aequorivita flava TaxID=3114371 RepID=A0AB35YN56_9FLAO